MNIDVVMNSLSRICGVSEIEDGFRITTSCMYPSSGLVRVYVRGGKDTAVVSDDGEALGEATAAGIHLEKPDSFLRNFVQTRGLNMKGGVLIAPVVDIKAAHIAVLHVANVAGDVAQWVYERGGMKRRQDFRVMLAQFLENSFGDNLAQARIFGASNKHHKFSNVISFANGRKLIVDAVANEPSSINARVVANLDVKSAHNPNVVQRIVFDDAERWSSSDLSLLQIGATLVPFSRAQDVIRRVAEETRMPA